MTDSIPVREFAVSGMSCGHCRSAVEAAIRGVPGVKTVHVDLESEKATVEGDANLHDITRAVEEAGYHASLE